MNNHVVEVEEGIYWRRDPPRKTDNIRKASRMSKFQAFDLAQNLTGRLNDSFQCRPVRLTDEDMRVRYYTTSIWIPLKEPISDWHDKYLVFGTEFRNIEEDEIVRRAKVVASVLNTEKCYIEVRRINLEGMADLAWRCGIPESAVLEYPTDDA